ncbi:MAG: RNA 2',3'-cyclic phosphodiesterase [Clostridia bacterium]|nr:RNA 2',3'-cyclic phosphodiesterase [Clostridia bacterium]
MRLFIALEFPREIKDELYKSGVLLRLFCSSGNFTTKDNFHITLVFIGETDQSRVKEIKQIIDGTEIKDRMEISIGKTGNFRRDDGLFVRFAECGRSVYKLRDELADALIESGFPIDKKPLKPHITMARKACLTDPGAAEKINSIITPLSFVADSITLMRSDRINGKLTYTPVYKKEYLKKD